jgi:hypothetical protein
MDFATLMNDQAPDFLYFVDAELIQAYDTRKIPKWNEYVDYVSKKGRRFFATALVRSRLRFRLPPPFHPYDEPNYPETDFKVETSLPLLFKIFKIKSYRFAHDLRWVFGSGCGLIQCQFTHLEAAAMGVASPVVCIAITSNDDLVQRFFKRSTDRKKFEKVVHISGLGHLADVRAVDFKSGTYRDYPCITDSKFPSVIDILSDKVRTSKSLLAWARSMNFFAC